MLLPLFAAVSGWLLWRRCWRTAAYWAGTVVFAELLVKLLKLTLGRHRPLAIYHDIELFSFPSGHATLTTVVLFSVAFLAAHGQSARWRLGMGAFACVYVVLVAFSRLYLGAHWMSDVLGGIALGTAWVALVAMVYNLRRVDEALGSHGLAAVSMATLALAGASSMRYRAAEDLRVYAAAQPPHLIAMQEWMGGAWRELPLRRHEFAGDPEEPFALQWACDADTLRGQMASAGWMQSEPWSLRSALAAVVPATPIQQWPVLPRFDRGRLSLMNLVRAVPGRLTCVRS